MTSQWWRLVRQQCSVRLTFMVSLGYRNKRLFRRRNIKFCIRWQKKVWGGKRWEEKWRENHCLGGCLTLRTCGSSVNQRRYVNRTADYRLHTSFLHYRNTEHARIGVQYYHFSYSGCNCQIWRNLQQVRTRLASMLDWYLTVRIVARNITSCYTVYNISYRKHHSTPYTSYNTVTVILCRILYTIPYLY